MDRRSMIGCPALCASGILRRRCLSPSVNDVFLHCLPLPPWPCRWRFRVVSCLPPSAMAGTCSYARTACPQKLCRHCWVSNTDTTATTITETSRTQRRTPIRASPVSWLACLPMRWDVSRLLLDAPIRQRRPYGSRHLTRCAPVALLPTFLALPPPFPRPEICN